MLPSHYLNQYWLIICEVQGQSPQGNFTRDTLPLITKTNLRIEYLKFPSNLPGVNELMYLLSPYYRWVIHDVGVIQIGDISLDLGITCFPLYFCTVDSTLWWCHMRAMSCNWPISQIPGYIEQISHNAPFCNKNVHKCVHFCYKMMHRGLWDWCILGFMQQMWEMW